MSTFAFPVKTKQNQVDLNSTSCLVDPEWENLDPTPDIYSLFSKFNAKFFAGKLSCVELEWSVRMYQCAGICYSRRNRMGMACVIRLSEPLLKLRSRKDLVETLLHEMIHAWNFIRGIMEGNGGHGQQFLSKMNEINRVAGTNISVYHTFNDEVELYKKHWWRCDGVCKDRHPYFGFVKRTCNRAPGPNDLWWKQHEQTCGGKFIKVKEPEKVVKKGKENSKTKKVAQPSPKNTKVSPAEDIRKFFKPSPKKEEVATPKPSTSFQSSPGGHALGGSKTGRSRLLDMFDERSKKVEGKKRKLPSNEEDSVILVDDTIVKSGTSFHDRIKMEFAEDGDDDIIFIDDEFDDTLAPQNKFIEAKRQTSSDTCHCPCCNTEIEVSKINDHLDQCLGM